MNGQEEFSTIETNNQIIVTGEITSEFFYNHKNENMKFYTVYVASKRDSGTEDVIPVVVSGDMTDVTKNLKGSHVSLKGRIITHNLHEGVSKPKLVILVYADTFEIHEEGWLPTDAHKDVNKVILEGYICKEPAYRRTPAGREITDILLAVNNRRGSSYIPCIAWGNSARVASMATETGTCIRLTGRFQSRQYTKKLDDTTRINRVAYEVSIKKFDVVEED